jgi:DNA-binding NtrC family response regulator
MCPVIMITGHSTLQRVQAARNAGVNEFLAKPLTARGVVERISQVINHPRQYVRAPNYFGPDRRRRADPNYHGPWRREDDAALRKAATGEA